jgi:hypothetical protein
MTATKEQVRAALDAVVAVADLIRALGSVPSGELYARLMGHMDLETYDKIIGILKRAGLVAESNHRLTWVGPKEVSNG